MGQTVLGPLRPDLAGDGPFGLKKLTADEVIIERNPGYGRPLAGNVRRFLWRQLRGEKALAALARGEVDVVAANFNDPALRAASDPNTIVVMGAPVQSLMVVFGSWVRPLPPVAWFPPGLPGTRPTSPCASNQIWRVATWRSPATVGL
jgi:hypothetical protein